MVVLRGGAISYGRGTPVELALLTLQVALPIVARFVQGVMDVGAQRCQPRTLLKSLKSDSTVIRDSSRLRDKFVSSRLYET